MSTFRKTIVTLYILSIFVPVHVESLATRGSKTRSGGGGFGTKANWKAHEQDESPQVQRLIQVLQSQKADISNVDVGYTSDCKLRGLFATKNFKKGKTICKIPSDVALALSDPAKQGDDAPTVAHGGVNFLQMYNNDPAKREMWSFYLDTLPRTVDETPDFLSDEELDLLEFPRVVQRAKERKRQVQDLSQETKIPLEELQYATWIVSSRAFPISLSPDEETAASFDDRGQVISNADRKWIRVLVPFIDLANHNSEPNAKMTLIDPQKDEAWFALEATRSITKGKEITIAYGSGVDSTAELYLNYGFVPKQNRMDTLMLKRGGDDTLSSLDGWSTTLEEDRNMLEMTSDDDVTLKKILSFRVKLKEAYNPKEP